MAKLVVNSESLVSVADAIKEKFDLYGVEY